MIQVIRYEDAQAFYDHAIGFLLQQEAANCLQIGIATNLVRGAQQLTAPPYMGLVVTAGEIVGVVMRTPPYNLILSALHAEDAAQEAALLAAIRADVADCYDSLPGVLGPKAIVKHFAQHWPQEARLVLSERIYKIEQLQPLSGIPGTWRHIQPQDRALVLEWLLAFEAEALPMENHVNSEARFQHLIDQCLDAAGTRGMIIWEDGGLPVSIAGYGGPTPHGMRIGPVYTPPEQRRRGYASAVTAAATQHLLDEGRRFVFLFTDLGNPTSNHIYMELGYRPVRDVDMYHFSQPSQGA